MINPGIYSQIKVSGTTTKLILNPGVYVIAGGGLAVSGSASIVGNGVIIYAAGTLYPSAGGTYGGISLNTTGTVNLSAPTTGTYAGILFFEARANASAVTIAESATVTTSGAIYAADASLGITGTGTITGALVVYGLVINGTIVANTLPTDLADGAVAYSPAQIRGSYGINAPGGVFRPRQWMALVRPLRSSMPTTIPISASRWTPSIPSSD